MISFLKRSFKNACAFLNMLGMVYKCFFFNSPKGHKLLSIGKVIENNAKKNPNKTMIFFENQTYSWKQFNELSNSYAHFLLATGHKSGDTIALLMQNRVDFLAILVGASKIGVITGLINSNSKGRIIEDSISCINAKTLFFGEELSTLAIELTNSSVAIDRYVYVKDKNVIPAPNWALDFYNYSSPLPLTNLEVTQTISLDHPCYYIFSSGTSGTIKPSLLSNYRWYRASKSFAVLALKMKSRDVMYNFLPLYHGSGLHTAFGPVALTGASMVLKRKFSTQSFMTDIKEYKISCFSYIGEVCRYILNNPENINLDKNHTLKCTGNGISPEIWSTFKERLNISSLCEFYALTEGNLAFFNALNKDKTIGFSPKSYAVVKYDFVKGELMKDERGYSIRVNDNSAGLLITKIQNKKQLGFYLKGELTKNRVLTNVFRKGDAYFNTCDILRKVDVGFSFGIRHYQFVDRIEDTYRWKGENVSSVETADIINKCDEVEMSFVFGVKLPFTEGKAGMAAILPKNEEFDIQKFSIYLSQNLSTFAKPVFLRVIKDVELTSTYKIVKNSVREDQFHLPSIKEDKIFVLKPNERDYSVLDESYYGLIKEGSAGF